MGLADVEAVLEIVLAPVGGLGGHLGDGAKSAGDDEPGRDHDQLQGGGRVDQRGGQCPRGRVLVRLEGERGDDGPGAARPLGHRDGEQADIGGGVLGVLLGSARERIGEALDRLWSRRALDRAAAAIDPDLGIGGRPVRALLHFHRSVLDRDPLACEPDELGEVEVVATMVGGRWVHNPPPWS